MSQRRNIKAESETADLWQPKWNENQTYIPTTGMLLPWKVQWLGAGVWGLWSNHRVKTAAHCGERDRGDVREETVVGNAIGEKPGSHESKAVLLSHT